MESEINNFILVWTSGLASLCYCHAIGKFLPRGNARRFAILPVVCLFFYLPLVPNSMHLRGFACFSIAWLASFKLILFASGKGPLSSDPPRPLHHFIPLACLPIKAQQSPKPTKENQKSPLNYVTKLMLLVMCIFMYDYAEFLQPKVRWFLYAIHIYFFLEMLLAVVGAMTRILVLVELEPQFNEPYLATSLQNFWGRRWNLMVTNILRPTVYYPVRKFFAPLIGRNLAALFAVLVTFLVSGLMHELVFYTQGQVIPTGEVTYFFLLHGLSVAAEVVAKKTLMGKLWLPGIVSGPLTIAFVMYTSLWQLFPAVLRGNVDVKACQESIAFMGFVKRGRQVSPSDLTCPFL